MKKSERDITIDCLRGAGILFVVLAHSIQATLVVNDDIASLIWADIIYPFQMAFLFFVSGLSAAFTFPTDNLKRFFSAKVKRLFVPYLFWVIFHYLILLAMKIVPYRGKQNFLASLFLEMFISDFWFLRQLFFYFGIMILTNLLIDILEIQDALLTSVFLLWIGIPILYYVNSLMPERIFSNAIEYYLFFTVGFLIHKSGIYDSLRMNVFALGGATRIFILWACALTIICNIFISRRISQTNAQKAVIYTIIVLVGIIICSRNRWCSKITAEFGNNTLPIYGIHWCLLFSPLWRQNFYIKAFSSLPHGVSAFIVFIAWLVICYIIIKFGKKVEWLDCIAFGNRRRSNMG